MATTTSTADKRTSVAPRARAAPRIDLGTALVYVALIILALLFLLPFYLIVRNSLMLQTEIASFDWHWLPSTAEWDNFSTLFNDPSAPMWTGLRNSAIISIVTLFVSMLFASMAGFALARIPFRWRNVVFYIVLSTLMIPAAATFVPTFVVISALGGVNTLWGIIVPGLFSPFAAFLFRQFYLSFPRELEEAGRVDGLGYWGIYRHLLVPNSMPIFMSLGVLSVLASWNSFLWPLVIGQSPDTWTVQIVLSTFLTAQTINLSELFAGALVGILPVVVVFLLMQRYIVQGVTLSGIKG